MEKWVTGEPITASKMNQIGDSIDNVSVIAIEALSTANNAQDENTRLKNALTQVTTLTGNPIVITNALAMTPNNITIEITPAQDGVPTPSAPIDINSYSMIALTRTDGTGGNSATRFIDLDFLASGSVYGGEIVLNEDGTNTLSITWAKKTLAQLNADLEEFQYNTSYTYGVFRTNFTGLKYSSNTRGFCNSYGFYHSASLEMLGNTIRDKEFGFQYNTSCIVFRDDDYQIANYESEADMIAAWLADHANTYVVYPLDTPIEIPINIMKLPLLKGENQLSNDCDLPMQLTYYIDKYAEESVNERVSSLEQHFPGPGRFTLANGVASVNYAVAEGFNTQATNSFTHAEGYNTQATGYASHSEGSNAIASGSSSHAEGNAQANGSYSHAEGNNTRAEALASHAEGLGTQARAKSQHVFGEYNIPDTTSTEQRGSYVEIVGNGKSNNPSNARTLDWNGNEQLAGGLTLNAWSSNAITLTSDSISTQQSGIQENTDKINSLGEDLIISKLKKISNVRNTFQQGGLTDTGANDNSEAAQHCIRSFYGGNPISFTPISKDTSYLDITFSTLNYPESIVLTLIFEYETTETMTDPNTGATVIGHGYDKKKKSYTSSQSPIQIPITDELRFRIMISPAEEDTTTVISPTLGDKLIQIKEISFLNIETDTTLSESNHPADAAATGEQFNNINTTLSNYNSNFNDLNMEFKAAIAKIDTTNTGITSKNTLRMPFISITTSSWSPSQVSTPRPTSPKDVNGYNQIQFWRNYEGERVPLLTIDFTTDVGETIYGGDLLLNGDGSGFLNKTWNKRYMAPLFLGASYYDEGTHPFFYKKLSGIDTTACFSNYYGENPSLINSLEDAATNLNNNYFAIVPDEDSDDSFIVLRDDRYISSTYSSATQRINALRNNNSNAYFVLKLNTPTSVQLTFSPAWLMEGVNTITNDANLNITMEYYVNKYLDKQDAIGQLLINKGVVTQSEWDAATSDNAD